MHKMTVSLLPVVPDQISQDDYDYPVPLVPVVPDIVPIMDDFIVDIRIFDMENNVDVDENDSEFMALIAQIHPTILFGLESMLEPLNENDEPLTRSGM